MMDTNNIRATDEHLYPEVYNKFAPVAEQLIRDMEKNQGDIYLTEDLLRQMTDEAIKRAEADLPAEAVQTEADAETEDAVPVIYQYGGRGRPGGGHRGGRWRGYDRGALDDIFRILFLQQIFGRRRPHWRWR